MALNVKNYTDSNLAYLPFIEGVIRCLYLIDRLLVPSSAAGKKIELNKKRFNQPEKIESYELFFSIAGTNYVQVVFYSHVSCSIYCNDPELFPKIERALTKLDSETFGQYTFSLEGRDVRTAK